jgi:hypothetical protein
MTAHPLIGWADPSPPSTGLLDTEGRQLPNASGVTETMPQQAVDDIDGS